MQFSSLLQSEGLYPSDWLKREADNFYSREQVTILAGSGSDRVLTNGMVLGKITSGGKYVQMNPDASDGSQNAAGVLLFDITAENGVDNTQGVIIRRDAIVSQNGLVWSSDTDLDQDAAEAQLVVLGILVREGA